MESEDRPVAPVTVGVECQPQSCLLPKRVATKCGHPLHPSASPHTPNCPACTLATAKSRLETAQELLLLNGGLERPWNLRDAAWNRARLKYNIANRRMEDARKRDQLRWEREQTWDEARLRTDAVRVDEAWDSNVASDVSTCGTTTPSPDEPRRASLTYGTWWERPGALAPDRAPLTPQRLKRKRRSKAPVKPKGSPTMRRIIRSLRVAIAATEAEKQALQERYRTETVVRHKWRLDDETPFPADFWASPVSNVIARRTHRYLQDEKRKIERRARGNKLRQRPPRSSLSHCESAEALRSDEDLEEKIKLREEAEEQERLERKARKVGAEVGYLYFVGEIDGLDQWKEDYLRSNHNLVSREPVHVQRPEPDFALEEESEFTLEEGPDFVLEEGPDFVLLPEEEGDEQSVVQSIEQWDRMEIDSEP